MQKLEETFSTVEEVLYFFRVKLVNNNGKRLSWRASLIVQKIQIADPKVY